MAKVTKQNLNSVFDMFCKTLDITNSTDRDTEGLFLDWDTRSTVKIAGRYKDTDHVRYCNPFGYDTYNKDDLYYAICFALRAIEIDRNKDPFALKRSNYYPQLKTKE